MRRSLISVSAICLVLAGVVFWTRDETEAPAPRSERVAPPPPSPTTIAREPEPSIIPAHDAGVLDAPSAAAGTEGDAGALPIPVIEDAGAALPAPPVAEVPVVALDAGAARSPNDPRFGVRWGQTGLCGDEPLQRIAERRAALLATFPALGSA